MSSTFSEPSLVLPSLVTLCGSTKRQIDFEEIDRCESFESKATDAQGTNSTPLGMACQSDLERPSTPPQTTGTSDSDQDCTSAVQLLSQNAMLPCIKEWVEAPVCLPIKEEGPTVSQDCTSAVQLLPQNATLPRISEEMEEQVPLTVNCILSEVSTANFTCSEVSSACQDRLGCTPSEPLQRKEDSTERNFQSELEVILAETQRSLINSHRKVLEIVRNEMSDRQSKDSYATNRTMAPTCSSTGLHENLVLRPQWAAKPAKLVRTLTRGSPDGSAESVAFRERPLLEKHILDPTSEFRIIWNTCACLLLVYDVVSLPLEFLGVVQEPVIGWICRITLTLDFLLQCLASSMANGAINHVWTTTSNGYFENHFLIDILFIFAEWAELFASPGSTVHTVLWFFYVVRVARLLRFWGILQILHDYFRSERIVLVFDVITFMLGLLYLAHVVACFWYGLGNSSGGWVESFMDANDMNKMTPIGAYSLSLHWSLSQLTGGMDEVHPATSTERIFTLFVFVGFFISAAVFLGCLTSSLTRLHILTSGPTMKVKQLRWYLRENGINNALAVRIVQNSKFKLDNELKTHADGSIELLKYVSESLRGEMRFELYWVVLKVHPFFRRYVQESLQTVRKICDSAVSFNFIAPDTVVFDVGEAPEKPKMFITVQCELHYCSGSGKFSIVTSGEWVAEHCMWVCWVHQGKLYSRHESKLCAIDVYGFDLVVNSFQHRGFNPRAYAQEFLRRLQTYEGELTDLKLGGEESIVEFIARPVAVRRRVELRRTGTTSWGT